MTLPSQNRLNLRLERNRVESSSQKIHSPLFVLLYSCSPKNIKHSRFAILLSKKFARLAVDRNKTKRFIHQAIQENLNLLTSPHDIIFIPKKNIKTKTVKEISQDIENLFQQI